MPNSQSLAEIARITNDGPDRGDAEFLDALIGWLSEPPGRGFVGIKKQPPIGRMLWVLAALEVSVAVSGLMHFLRSRFLGRHLHDAEGWAGEMGATKTAAYLASAAGLLPGGRLLADQGEHGTFLDSIEEQGDPFVELDRQYRASAHRELPIRLRAYVASHLGEIEAAFPPREVSAE